MHLLSIVCALRKQEEPSREEKELNILPDARSPVNATGFRAVGVCVVVLLLAVLLSGLPSTLHQ
jgi:hypothetical protein